MKLRSTIPLVAFAFLFAGCSDAAGSSASTTGSSVTAVITPVTAAVRAPLDTACVTSSNPNVDCEFEVTPEPDGWAAPGFDDSAWSTATVYTSAEVGAKDGYDTIAWYAAAQLIWSSDLKVDNTILWRVTVTD